MENFNTPLYIKKTHPDAKIPMRSTNYAAAYDLYALFPGFIAPRSKQTIRTGISMKIPQLPYPCRTYGSIRSRSGLSNNFGLEVGAGVIDEDFNKEISVILHNHGDEMFAYKKHDRIAQLVLELFITPLVEEVLELPELENNNRKGGFGSTGI
jgi:dUTP pyrophosphatase